MFRKSRFAVIALIAQLLLPTSSQAVDLPDSTITTLSGQTIELQDYLGKQSVYLKVWASWCQPCMEQMPHFQHVQATMGDKIKVIGINLGINEDRESVAAVISKYGLTMDTVIDDEGKLAHSLGMIGTPFHALFDKQGTLVYRGHEANKKLDKTLEVVSKGKQPQEVTLSEALTPSNTKHIAVGKHDYEALFFTATWCDWYFKETRPMTASQCELAPKDINQLMNKHANVHWQGIVTHYWTGAAEVRKYQERLSPNFPIEIDPNHALFREFGVRSFPTVVLLKEGKEMGRTGEYSSSALQELLRNTQNGH